MRNQVLPLKLQVHIWSRTKQPFPCLWLFCVWGVRKQLSVRQTYPSELLLAPFVRQSGQNAFKKIFLGTCAHEKRVSLTSSQRSKYQELGNPSQLLIERRTTLFFRLQQAPGELIADIPHFKHLPYVCGKYSHATYHFLFFFHWFMFYLE